MARPSRPMRISFAKMHGLGNDFVMVEASSGCVLPEAQLPDLARRMCHRHQGIGADGLVLLLPSTAADLRMRMFNPDGSEAEMCGNGIRCLAGFARSHGFGHQDELMVETAAGLLGTRLVSHDSESGAGLVQVAMGTPRLQCGEIPLAAADPAAPALDVPVELDGVTYRATAVSMGNPHAVFFLDAQEGTPLQGMPLAQVPLAELGPRLETHPRFPRHANIEFATRVGPDEIATRVWERGAGATRACGTGACAVMVAACLTGRSGEEASIILPGGPLRISWRHRDQVYMTGPYQFVFEGEWHHAWHQDTLRD